MMEESLPRELHEPIEELRQHYSLLRLDERGANGYLIFAENRVTKQQLAIKFYYGSQGERQHDEPRTLARISSPHVLPIFDARTASDGWAYFVTPLCTGGDLDDYIARPPSAHEAIDAALGICAGVSAIHALNMVHRDIKPANVVVEQGVPLIADFGSVRKLPDSTREVSASGHSVLFRPPESFDGGGYGRLGDIYQLGIVTYQLLGGNLPYNGELYLNRKETMEYERLTDQFERSRYIDACIRRLAERGRLLDLTSLPPWIDQSTKRVLRSMTAPDPRVRTQSVSDVAAALSTARARLANWRRTPNGARHEGVSPPIELRLKADNRYEAFVVRTQGVRRVRGSTPKVLPELVKEFS